MLRVGHIYFYMQFKQKKILNKIKQKQTTANKKKTEMRKKQKKYSVKIASILLFFFSKMFLFIKFSCLTLPSSVKKGRKK